MNIIAMILIFLPLILRSPDSMYGEVQGMYCTAEQAAGVGFEGNPGTRIDLTWNYKTANGFHITIEEVIILEEHGQGASFRNEAYELISVFWSSGRPVNLVRADCIDLGED